MDYFLNLLSDKDIWKRLLQIHPLRSFFCEMFYVKCWFWMYNFSMPLNYDTQRHIQNRFKYLRWSLLRKWRLFAAGSGKLFSQKFHLLHVWHSSEYSLTIWNQKAVKIGVMNINKIFLFLLQGNMEWKVNYRLRNLC